MSRSAADAIMTRLRHDAGLDPDVQVDAIDLAYLAEAADEIERLHGLVAMVAEYRLQPVPVTDEIPDGYAWDVHVVRHIDGTWSIQSLFRVVDATGQWVATGRRSEVPTFPLDEALHLADAAQWTLTVNRKTARQALAEYGQGGGQ